MFNPRSKQQEKIKQEIVDITTEIEKLHLGEDAKSNAPKALPKTKPLEMKGPGAKNRSGSEFWAYKPKVSEQSKKDDLKSTIGFYCGCK